jgi:hypothetical protein
MEEDKDGKKKFPWTPINTRLTDLPVPDSDEAYSHGYGISPQYCAYVSWEPLEHIIHVPNSYTGELVPTYWDEYMKRADWNALKVAWQRHIYRFYYEKEFDSDLEDGSWPVDHYEFWGEPEEPEEYDPIRHTDPITNNEDYLYVKRQIAFLLEERFGISFALPESLDVQNTD